MSGDNIAVEEEKMESAMATVRGEDVILHSGGRVITEMMVHESNNNT
jgi:hypothetical protein